MGACLYPQRPAQYRNVGGTYRGNYGPRQQAQPRRASAGSYPQQPARGSYPQQPAPGSYPQQPAPSSYPQQPASGSSFPPQQAVGSSYAPQPTVLSSFPPNLSTYPPQQGENYGPSHGAITQQYAAPPAHDTTSREIIHQPIYGPVHTAPNWNPTAATSYTPAQPLMGVQMSQPATAVATSQPMWNTNQPTVRNNILPPVSNSFVPSAVTIPSAVTFPPAQTYEWPQPQVIHPVPAQTPVTCRMPALPPCKPDWMGVPSVQRSIEIYNNTAPSVSEQLARQPLYQ